MTCRASRLSSAVVTFARDMSGLQDNQVLGLNHALMQEGHQAPTPTVDQWNALIDDVQNRYRMGLLTLNPGSHDPLTRLEAARNETPDGERYYAIQRLVERADAAAQAQNEYFHAFARTSGISLANARAHFYTAFNAASDNARLAADAIFSQQWTINPDNSALPVDRRSLYAFQQMELLRANASGTESRPNAQIIWQFEPREEGRGYISGIAYEAEHGHLEITWARDGQDSFTHVYRDVPLEYLNHMIQQTEGDRETFFRTHISGQSEYRYATTEEANAARTTHRCNTCGQFAILSQHTCPVNGSPASLNRDTLVAINAARTAAGLTPLGGEDIHQVSATGTRRYEAGNGIMRIPGISRVLSEARNHSRALVPVQASVGGNTVSGMVLVSYNGRGNGYTVTGDQIGDNIDHRLRCACPTYQVTRDCEHVQALLASLSGLANGVQEATPAQVVEAVAAITPDLTAEFEASVTATTAAAAAAPVAAVKLAEDPTQFQDIYEEVRAARTAWQADQDSVEFPVPYLTENAFGGLGTRASGRGFGIELEYAFPHSMSSQEVRAANQAIGRELYQLGLTRNQSQGGYGASHGWFRDFHQGGWSFENDFTTGGGDAQTGGEIVSPVMFDEPETWTNIAAICDVLKRHGATFSKGSGMHVHVGVGDYDHRVENHNRLLNAFAENEDLIYRLSANPIRGRHRGTGYCGPNRAATSPYQSVDAARREHNSHGIGLNLQSVSGRSGDHVEFRTFDSSLVPGVIQAQAAMAVFMAEGATRPGRSTTPSEGRTPIGTRLNANPDRGSLTGAAWNESTLSVRKFIDDFVPVVAEQPKDNPIVRQMVALFATTKWQGRRNRTAPVTPVTAPEA